MEDRVIIKHIKNKDEKGLELLIDKYGDYINTIVKNNLSTLRYHQDECTNDVYLSIWMNINSYNKNKNTFKNWIGTVAKHRTIDYKRKYIKDIQLEKLDENLKQIDENLLRCEIEENVNDLLLNLSDEDRQVFVKRYLEDKDIETISREMNIKSNNIYTKISRCKQKLRKLAIPLVICISISVVVLGNDKVWALVENIGRQIEEYFNKNKDEFEGYKVPINETVEDKDIKMTLYEVLLDDGQIMLSMNMDHSEFDESTLKKGIYKNKNYYWNKASVYIDDKKFILGSGGTSFEKEVDDKQDFLTTIGLYSIDNDDDGYVDVEQYNLLENIDPNKDYEMKVVFEQIGIQQVGFLSGAKYSDFNDIDGKWEFNFTVNGENIINKTKTYNIDKAIEINDEEFKANLHIKELRVSPISTKLIYTVKMGDGYEFKNRHIDIELQDQDSNVIALGSSGGGNKEQTYMNMELETYQSEIEKMTDVENLKSIKIVPYQYYREKGSNNHKYHHTIKYEDKAITIDIK